MTVFFLFYFLSFFIPTDQIAAPEIYWSGAFYLMLLFRYTALTTAVRSIGKTTNTLWITLISVIAIGLLYSRSPAATSLSLIRYIQAYAAFILGKSWSNEKNIWTDTFRVYASVMICIFILCAGFPFFARLIPPYTSLLTVNGHHPFAAFLLLFLPFALFSKRKQIVSNTEKAITIAGLILSSARISWGIAFIFVCIKMYTTGQKKIHPFLIGLFGVTLCGVIWTTTLPYTRTSTTSSALTMNRFQKDLNIGLRWEYVVQTLRAIKNSPIIGYGSGTFALISRQFASGPGVFARYAHSFPLETLSEHGLIGSLPIFLLVLSIGVQAIMSIRQKKPHPELSWALILTLAYSMVDVNLNILPIWILFWVLAGLIYPRTASDHSPLRSYILYGLVCVFGLVGLSGAASISLDLSGQPFAAFISAPYRKSTALDVIHTMQSQRRLSDLQWWYRNDPDIYFGMKQYNVSFVRSALTYDPYNYQYLQYYLTQAVFTKNTNIIRTFLCNPSRISFKTSVCSASINRTTDDLIAYQTETLAALSHLQGNDGLSKTLYFLGLSTFETTHNIPAAIYLLEQARNNAPNWGYYHVALSSAQYTWEHNERAAIQTLANCKSHPTAAIGCAYSHPYKLFPPESYGSDIARIPEIQ